MIPSIRQLREARANDTTSDFAIPADDGSPLIDWDLDGVEGLSGTVALSRAARREASDGPRISY